MGLNNDHSRTFTFRAKFATLVVLFFTVTSTSAQLSSTYYSSTCPSALSIIKSVVASAIDEEARMGASLLRLQFHDCFVNGCDGSVLLDDTTTFTGEKHSIPNNNSLRGFDVIDTIKSELETSCPGIVSCADIVAVAARDSVVSLGGPRWEVLLGRRDATTTSLSATSALPGSKLNLTDLISAFSAKGFTAKEMVALSGSHTIGQTRCLVFQSRIYNETNIEPSFAMTRQANCPLSGGDDNLAPLDLSTPNTFDNTYFKNLLAKKGLLHSDQQLYNDGSTDSYVSAYASNPGSFRTDFANAMVKLGNLSPLTGTSGQVRTNCRKIN